MVGCFVSQRYWKMKAIHNYFLVLYLWLFVVLYPKDTEKWKQFTTIAAIITLTKSLFCIPKILKNESNSQQWTFAFNPCACCFVSQRYWKMKAIHNYILLYHIQGVVVLYPKDTEKWKQFTTNRITHQFYNRLFCIPKILKNESNSQQLFSSDLHNLSCFVSQRYWKMKAIHNYLPIWQNYKKVVLYPKDTEKWKQFTTGSRYYRANKSLFCIPKILKNESNSQHY